jgi:hypothetical protein
MDLLGYFGWTAVSKALHLVGCDWMTRKGQFTRAE